MCYRPMTNVRTHLLIPDYFQLLLLFCIFANEKQLAVLLVNCFVLGKYRDVTKISSYRVKLSRLGIRHLGISFGCIVLLFSHESGQGKILAPPLNDSPERSDFLFLDLVAPPPHPPLLQMQVFLSHPSSNVHISPHRISPFLFPFECLPLKLHVH